MNHTNYDVVVQSAADERDTKDYQYFLLIGVDVESLINLGTILTYIYKLLSIFNLCTIHSEFKPLLL